MSNNKSGFSSKRADLMHTSKKKPMILEFGEDMVESTGQFKDSLVVELVKQFSQDNENSDILIPHNDEIRQLQGKLVGKIVILCGPSRCGKSSALRWALRNSHTSIVRIDCRIYSTDVQFIERLTKEIGRCLGEPLLTKSNVFTETVNFTELNNIIRLRRRQFIVLVKYAQKLTNCKKQMILYNLFEWMKTDVQKYIGVVLTFSTSFFVVGMDKRVLSRFTGKSYQLQHFSGQDVMEALALRVDILIKKKKGNRKKGITFQQNANNHISQQSKEMEILTKLSHAMHSQKVESFFVESQNSRPQNIIYFLNLFRFAITGRLRDQKLLLNMSSTKLEEELVKELEIAKEEIGEELQMERNLFIGMLRIIQL